METQISLKDAIADLEVLIGNLDDSDHKFAHSLINGEYGYKKRGFLSPKQSPYIYKLLEKAAGTSDGGRVHINVTRIKAMFEKAKAHLKYPKVVFETSFGAVKMYTQGDKAKYPGAIVIILNKLWMGRIHTDGGLQKGVNFNESSHKDEFLSLLAAFSADPEGVASKYGKMHSKCVFCMLPLNDPKSLAVGYGPVCADHYGLQWGSKVLSTPEIVS